VNQVPLNLANLKQLDFGKIAVAFDAEMAHVVKDCMDRPGDEKARKVTITFLVAPVVDTQSRSQDCDKVAVGCEIASTVPKRRTQVYHMQPRQDGQLGFHPDLPSEPDGSTLYDPENVDKNTGEVKDE
jgi:hypothetical protein